MNGAIAILEQPPGSSQVYRTRLNSATSRYYAAESLWAFDQACQSSDADVRPSYGEDTLEQFFEWVERDGIAGQVQARVMLLCSEAAVLLINQANGERDVSSRQKDRCSASSHGSSRQPALCQLW